MTQSSNGHKRAVLYARVSTDDQADKGYSLPSQLDLARKYAERLGFSVVNELTEDYSGAAAVAERPTGKQLAAMVKERVVDAVIVYQVDRLSRDIVDLLATVRQWLRAGIEIHTCDIGKIESELDIVLVIKGWQGSDERKKILERTMRGKRAKAESGKVVCARVPYGYRAIRDARNKIIGLEIFDETARVVRVMYRWYVYGDEDGKPLTFRAIARRLSEVRVLTPGELQSGYKRKRSSGMWSATMVMQIIAKEVYAGVWYFGLYEKVGKSYRVNPTGKQIAVSVPQIVDRETWERAQARRSYKAMAKRNARHDYLLHGLIRCGVCGASMTGKHHTGVLYYACTSVSNLHAALERECHARMTRAEAIEADVWQEIEELFSNLDRLWNDLKVAQQRELDAQEPKRAELQAIEGLIEQANREITEIVVALPKASGRIGETLQAKADEVNARYDALIRRRANLQAELGARRLTDDAVAEIMQYARDIQEGIQNADYDAKRRILESLGVLVRIKEGQYSIDCVLGHVEGTIRRVGRFAKRAIETCTSTQNSHGD
ncbi:MAG: hypothetical protein FJ009_16080 [Chloroflexi bacterium]|nr:hypothetical protein [Chloroflexota bacterium]